MMITIIKWLTGIPLISKLNSLGKLASADINWDAEAWTMKIAKIGLHAYVKLTYIKLRIMRI